MVQKLLDQKAGPALTEPQANSPQFAEEPKLDKSQVSEESELLSDSDDPVAKAAMERLELEMTEARIKLRALEQRSKDVQRQLLQS